VKKGACFQEPGPQPREVRPAAPDLGVLAGRGRPRDARRAGLQMARFRTCAEPGRSKIARLTLTARTGTRRHPSRRPMCERRGGGPSRDGPPRSCPGTPCSVRHRASLRGSATDRQPAGRSTRGRSAGPRFGSRRARQERTQVLRQRRPRPSPLPATSSILGVGRHHHPVTTASPDRDGGSRIRASRSPAGRARPRRRGTGRRRRAAGCAPRRGHAAPDRSGDRRGPSGTPHGMRGRSPH